MAETTVAKHTWRFYRAGGLDQVLLRTGADIENLAQLDQKLWVSLSCPTSGIRFDGKTLERLDADKDGRIRAPELLKVIAWLKVRLTSLDSLIPGSESLPLTAINDATPEGKALLINAKRTLTNLGKADAAALTLADVTDTAAIFAKTHFNGDGVIPVEAAEDDDTRKLVADIMATQGAVTDRTGKPGVDQGKADAFFASATAFVTWHRRADATILPLDDKTAAAFGAFDAVRAKIEDYFTRCRLAAFDGRAAAPLNRGDADFVALAGTQLDDGEDALDSFPLSHVEAGRDLPLQGGLNPHWAAAITAFHAAVVTPLLGDSCDILSAAQWQKLNTIFAPYEAWMGAKAGTDVAGLGVERLEALIAGNAQKTLNALIARDLALEPENAKIDELECLLRYHANFSTLLNNYVNLSFLYDPNASAIFQVGTLYMDARACTLCFHVDNAAAHSAQATAGKCCLAYCMLTRQGSKETRLICAVFTSGFARTLWVGRNGIFYDREGRDWDAVIVQMVANPIGLKEAFWDPWRKLAEMVGNQVKKMLAAKNEAVLTGASKTIETTATASASTAAPKKMEGAALASSVAAIGIAIGLIGSAIGGLIGAVSGLPPWKTALGLLAVVLLVSGPSVILTWFKLRARDLAPILNACGWAINRPLHMSLKLGRLFTSEATLPEGAKRQLSDPYADDKKGRVRVLVWGGLLVLALALWWLGLLNNILPVGLQTEWPFGCP